MEEEGLVSALNKFVKDINQAGKTLFDLQVKGLSDRLANKIEFELYCIVLELSQNILKHADATTAVISFFLDDSRLQLTVIDNGIGLNEDQENGMGIKNVANRVKSLDGTWQIVSDESGLMFKAMFPLNLER